MLQLGILSLGFHSLIYNAFAVKWIKSECLFSTYSLPFSSPHATNVHMPNKTKETTILVLCGAKYAKHSVCRKKSRYVIKYGKKYLACEIQGSHTGFGLQSSLLDHLGLCRSLWFRSLALWMSETIYEWIRRPIKEIPSLQGTRSQNVQSWRCFSVCYYFYY